MGSVSVDLHKKEREYSSLTLSDKTVIKYLISFRSKLDIGYNSENNTIIDVSKAGDIFEFNQELISLYVSLDNLIDKCDLNKKQMELLKLIFEGNKISDICSMDIGYGKSATYTMLNKIIHKIKEENDKDWKMMVKNNI